MANYLDQMGDMIRSLMRSGMPEDAAIAAARAAQNAPPAPVRQMELPMPSDMGVERTPDFLARMRATHLVDDNYGPSARQAVNNSPDIAPLASTAGPDMSLGSDLWHQMDKGARGYENILKGRTGNLRNQNPQLARIAQQNIQEANARSAKMRAAMEASAARGEVMQDVGMTAGGLAAAGAGAYALTRAGMGAGQKAAAPAKSSDDPLFADKQPLTSTGGTAELANESRPVPAVPTSTSPRDQAQELIAKLNQMRRDAGGEVPEATQMMQEINRLMALSNQDRNAMTPQQSQGSDDPHIQAQALIARLNEMRAAQPGGGEVPQAQQIMAEVRRLQALGDQRRNAAQTR